MTHILIDTNVIIDFLAHREPYFEDALRLLTLVTKDEIEGSVTAGSVTDIYYILRKHLKDPGAAKKNIEKLLSIVGVLDVREEDMIAALASPMKDFEDAVVAGVAVRCRVDYIVTRNMKDFKDSPVPALEPKDFELN